MLWSSYTVFMAGVLLAAVPGSAGAAETIFTRENQRELCRGGTVDRVALAGKMIDDANVPASLLRVVGVSDEALLMMATSDNPFGTGPAAATPAAIAATQRLTDTRLAASAYIALGGREADGYRVDSDLPTDPTSDDVLLRPDKVSVHCLPVTAAAAASDPSKRPNPGAEALSKRLLIRSEVSELGLPADQIAKIRGTTFSYARDDENDTETIIADGTVGWKLAYGSNGPTDLSLIPYLKFKAINKTPGDRTSYVEPGLLLDSLHISENYAARMGLHASDIIDSSNDSEQASLSAYVIPSFRIPRGDGTSFVLFGGYSRPIGPLAFRPEVQFLMQGRDIVEAGTNPALAGKSSYFGLGGKGILDLALVGVPVLQELRARVEYTLMENFNVDDVSYLKATLMYPLFPSKRSTLNLEYSDGRDPNTLLEEQRYTLGVALRY
jgi:hypothetical protein